MQDGTGPARSRLALKEYAGHLSLWRLSTWDLGQREEVSQCEPVLSHPPASHEVLRKPSLLLPLLSCEFLGCGGQSLGPGRFGVGQVLSEMVLGTVYSEAHRKQTTVLINEVYTPALSQSEAALAQDS